MIEPATRLYRKVRVRPEILWRVETDGIAVIATIPGRYYRFAYPEAAVWDGITQGHSAARLLRLLMVLTGYPAPLAAEWLLATLRAFIAADLVAVEDAGDG